jgi:3-dehydroquinate synthase
MKSIQGAVQVCLRHRVYFTEELFRRGNSLLRDVLVKQEEGRPHRVLVVMDEGVHQAQPQLAVRIEDYVRGWDGCLDLVRAPLILEGGERLKNSYFHVSEIQSEIERHGVDRHSFLMAVGGGALLDVAGLAAATAHRGIRLVRIPSTTLSQADSGVGIKNGINAYAKKNFVGTFAVPFAVINDFSLLDSLSTRDKRSGYSEAVKVACIKDRAFFELIEREVERLKHFDALAMRRLIHRSAELHVRHITTCGDPFEFGSARPLDFGHWAAHKLEQLSGFRLRHGEAVAIGIAVDVVYSRLKGFLAAEEADRVLGILQGLGFELFAAELVHTDATGALQILGGLEEFRTHLGGELSVTLLRGIGDPMEAHEMELGLVTAAIRELEQRFKKTAQQPAKIGGPGLGG